MDYVARVACANTFPKLLRLNALEYSEDVAFREKDFGVWREFTWADYQTRVHDFALGLVDLGLERGDAVALIGDNRPDWVAGEIAAHAVGAMSLGHDDARFSGDLPDLRAVCPAHLGDDRGGSPRPDYGCLTSQARPL